MYYSMYLSPPQISDIETARHTHREPDIYTDRQTYTQTDILLDVSVVRQALRGNFIHFFFVVAKLIVDK